MRFDNVIFGELGRGRGRVLQRFWDHVEVKRAGGANGRWTQTMSVPPYLSLSHEQMST